ncbi:YtjB family periplasmic protein [Photobacterium alginatilyticum]|uniref:YtjB family periplasmic protein n=1 Tax=Photobacterium alginatilyticum TaxID=1775171 RepID=UPI0040688998
MMILKKTRLQRTWQLLVLIASLGGLVAMLEYGSDLNLRSYRALSEQTQSLSRIIVRQAAGTAAKDILDNNQDKLQALVQQLSEEPLILDASIYDLEGIAVAKTEEAMPLEQVTGISTPLSVASFGRQQIVEPVMADKQVIGFVRITLEHGKLLEDAASQVEYMTNIIRGLILAALFIGFLLAFTFGRRKDIWHFPFLLTSNAKD